MPLTSVGELVLRALEVDLRSAGLPEMAVLVDEILAGRESRQALDVAWMVLYVDPHRLAPIFRARLRDVMEILDAEESGAAA